VDFVEAREVAELLDGYRIAQVEGGPDCLFLEMESEGAVQMHLAAEGSEAVPHDGASVVPVPRDRLPALIEHIMHRLSCERVVLIPVGKWRGIFDAVAFSLAENEEWRQIDKAATVELNTRDPLLCEPGDFHTLMALIGALLNDAERPEQGLMLVPTAAPVLVEIVHDGAVRIWLGNPVLADELAAALPG
jgi:hypothetical protein